LNSITCNSYFNRLIAFNIIVNSIIVSTNFNIISSQVCLYNSYFNKLIILNTKVDNKVFPKYIVYNSNSNKLLILNKVFLKYIVYNFNNNELLIFNLETSTIINNTFNI